MILKDIGELIGDIEDMCDFKIFDNLWVRCMELVSQVHTRLEDFTWIVFGYQPSTSCQNKVEVTV